MPILEVQTIAKTTKIAPRSGICLHPEADRLSDAMEKALSPVVVVANEQSRRLGFLNDQPAQRLNLGRLAPTRHIELR